MLKVFTIRFVVLLCFIQVSCFTFSQIDSLVFNKVPSYRDWNWEALVVENDYITMAVVPSMGGNILQYDFGVDTFLILNPATFGNSYNPALGQSPFTGDWGFGGFEVWPTPELWPPSPVITFGEYSDTILYQTADSIGIFLRSGIAIYSFPGIRYEKQITAYKNSTLIKFQNSMINTGSNSVKYGMMNVAEISTEHGDLEDFSNFRAYFPIKKNSIFGNHCVRISPASAAFKGEIAPGIYGVEYNRVRGKVFADSPEGWMAFVDERDTQTYVCLYDVYNGAEYPDQGANTEVYIENNVSFMALEAISPLVNLAPTTDTFRFTEYFASTSLNGIVLKVNMAGAVTGRLTYDTVTQQLTGKFGVFSKSTLQLFYCDSLGNILEEGKSFSAAPDTALVIDEVVELPVGTERIKLCAFNSSDDFIADLDEEDFKEDEFVTTSGIKENSDLEQNPVQAFYNENGDLQINFKLPENDFVTIDLINISGVVEKVLYSEQNIQRDQELSFNLGSLPYGVYLIRVFGRHDQYIHKVLLR